MSARKNPREGSTFESFLEEAGILEEVNAGAMKKLLALRLAETMRKQKISKAAMAKRMRTSRAQLDRLLDPENQSVTLLTMSKAASALGKRLFIHLDDAA
ncbi:MAG TPA: helix-turn-helix domain-containing protein [Rhizomicrobium sp.]|jgi:DNA-binding Xre family transcriptional regulator